MSRLRLAVRKQARGDLIDHYEWLARKADLSVADAMSSNADEPFAWLCDNPGAGSLVRTRRSALAELRKWRVPHVRNLPIFYLRDGNRLDIVRVLHASQDWPALLESR